MPCNYLEEEHPKQKEKTVQRLSGKYKADCSDAQEMSDRRMNRQLKQKEYRTANQN